MNDPNFVTTAEQEDDDDDDDFEVVPLAAPDFIGVKSTPAASLDELLISLNEGTGDAEVEEEDEDDALKLSVMTEFLDEGQPHPFDAEDVLVDDDVVVDLYVSISKRDNVDRNNNASAEDDDGSSFSNDAPTSSTPISTTWSREPKSIDKIFEGDPNVHSESFGVADLEGLSTGPGEGDPDFDHRQLQVAPSYVDDTMSESSPGELLTTTAFCPWRILSVSDSLIHVV